MNLTTKWARVLTLLIEVPDADEATDELVRPFRELATQKGFQFLVVENGLVTDGSQLQGGDQE